MSAAPARGDIVRLTFQFLIKDDEGTEVCEIDDIDQKIIEKLAENGRYTARYLASGLFGEKLNLFKGPCPCRKMYKYLPRMLKGSVSCVAFSTVDRLPFDPDLIIIVADLARANNIIPDTVLGISESDRIRQGGNTGIGLGLCIRGCAT